VQNSAATLITEYSRHSNHDPRQNDGGYVMANFLWGFAAGVLFCAIGLYTMLEAGAGRKR
jgi:hypothetical protein